MHREYVRARLEEFLGLLRREQELKEQLLALKMHGRRATPEEAAERLAAHDSLIAEIERLRQEGMLPILEEMARFVAAGRVNHVH